MSVDPLAALRARFIDRTRKDGDALETAFRSGDDAVVEHLAHNLAGAAGVFGFGDLGDAARAIDDAYAAGERPTSAAITDLRQRIMKLPA